MAYICFVSRSRGVAHRLDVPVDVLQDVVGRGVVAVVNKGRLEHAALVPIAISDLR